MLELRGDDVKSILGREVHFNPTVILCLPVCSGKLQQPHIISSSPNFPVEEGNALSVARDPHGGNNNCNGGVVIK